MSGIKGIVTKTKLSLDEMYDSQEVGKLEKKIDGKTNSQPTSQSDFQLKTNTDFQQAGKQFFQESTTPTIHETGQTSSNQAGDSTNTPNIKHQNNQINMFPVAKQQTYKEPTYKMTFNLSEDAYKNFNDLYAYRMLQGRKTEKSEMICEAIQWLVKMEKGLNKDSK